jgi:hypothetical protein
VTLLKMYPIRNNRNSEVYININGEIPIPNDRKMNLIPTIALIMFQDIIKTVASFMFQDIIKNKLYLTETVEHEGVEFTQHQSSLLPP